MQFSPSNIADRVTAFCTLVALLFCASIASAQTKEQLAAKHKEVAAFEIEPGIVAFSTFTRDGNVCEIIIHKLGYVDSQHSDFDSTIPDSKVDHLVDEVVAPTERGKPSKYLSPHSWMAGGAAFIRQDYENVSVSVYGSAVAEGPNHANVIVISWPKRGCTAPH